MSTKRNLPVAQQLGRTESVKDSVNVFMVLFLSRITNTIGALICRHRTHHWRLQSDSVISLAYFLQVLLSR